MRFQVPGDIGDHGLLGSAKIQHGFQQCGSVVMQEIEIPAAFYQLRKQYQKLTMGMLLLQQRDLIEDRSKDASSGGFYLDKSGLG